MIAVICSSRDIAGTTIKSMLLKNYGFRESGEVFDGHPVYSLDFEDEQVKLFTLSGDSIHAENLDEKIQADLFVFATRHVSRAGVPALTTHPVGNWSSAEFGGRERTICPTSPTLLKLFLQNLKAVAKSEGYPGEVTLESTHHGPCLERPAVFIELGSSEKEWVDERLASMVADSLVGGLGDYVSLENRFTNVLGLGGLHYCTAFRKLTLDSDYAVGHVCTKHHLSGLTPELLRQAMHASESNLVALDWKGLGKEKERIIAMLTSEKINFIKV